MFVRLKKHPGSKNYSILLCESYRDGKKVCQRIISFLGSSADPVKLQELKAEGEAFIEQIKLARKNPKEQTDSNCTLSLNTYEVARKNVGIRDTLGNLYDQLGFNKILRGKKVGNLLKSVVLTRFAEPSSKRKTCSILERRFNEEISLDSIYYMMDQLAENLHNSQRIVFHATKEVTGGIIDLALFDVTTLHLETAEQDELRNFGYSKNNKTDTTQVTLALATTKTGLPIGYQLFPGNTAEVSTLMACINLWKKIIKIDQVIIVGDRAMMSKNNVLQLQEHDLKYIIACPMKKANSELKETILNKENYTPININNESYLKQEINMWYNFCLMSELPPDHKPLPGKIYLKQEDDLILYSVIKGDKVYNAALNIKEELSFDATSDLSQLLLNEGFKKNILRITSKRGHTVYSNTNEKLVVTFSERRQRKDQHTRDKLISKLRKKLGVSKEAKRLISNKGYLKYTEIEQKTYAEIDEGKILEESKWDGLHGIVSNTNLSGEEIVERYKNLWVIEEAFRINKHNLKMRPIYHYTPKRINAHIEICFLTFALVRHAQYILKKAGINISVDELREELLPIEASVLCDRETGKFYRMPSQMLTKVKEIYKIFGREKDLEIQTIANQEMVIGN